MNRYAALRDRIKAARNEVDRRCEECKRPTRTIASLCWTHRRRRNLYGSVKVSRLLPRAEWVPLLPDVRRYLARHSVKDRSKVPGVRRNGWRGFKQRTRRYVAPPEVLESLARLLEPGQRLSRREQRPVNRRWILQRELLHLADYESRKHSTGNPRHVKRDYRPKELLAHMLAVAIVVEERPGMFPHEAGEYAIIGALLSMWKPRDNTQSGQPTVRRGLVDRLRKGRVYLWLLQNARQFLQDQSAQREAEQRTRGTAEVINPETRPDLFVPVRRAEWTVVGDLKVKTGRYFITYRPKNPDTTGPDGRTPEQRAHDYTRAARARAGKRRRSTSR